tara:strand:+ start:4060 stop:4386 length:327 start_codon:yes stop_codon:yes gene_type:complete
MKEFYPDIYNILSNSDTRDWKEIFRLINKMIKESEFHHCGMDMSGLSSLLSVIKKERFVLGYLDSSTKFYPEQFDEIELMYKNGICRDFVLPPYTLSLISSINSQSIE